jgi:integrase/recombinase XerD
LNFDHALTKFERYLWQNEYSKNTRKLYLRTIRQTLKGIDLDAFDQYQLDTIAINLVKKYETNGNRTRFAGLNLFCKEILKRTDLHLKIPRSKEKNKDVLTEKEVDKIIAASKQAGRADYLVILLLYDEALRKGETMNLNLEDIDYEAMEIKLRDTKTGDKIVAMTSRVSEALRNYILYEREPKSTEGKALLVNKYGVRIGGHYVRNHVKKCAVKAGITKRVYPHMLRASSITFMLNQQVNPKTVQAHARHKHLRQTMIYNRPTRQQMRKDIERTFVTKSELTDQDRAKAAFDKFLNGEITQRELDSLLSMLRPKQLKHESELSGYA